MSAAKLPGPDRIFHCNTVIRVIIRLEDQLAGLVQQLAAIAREIAKLHLLAVIHQLVVNSPSPRPPKNFRPYKMNKK